MGTILRLGRRAQPSAKPTLLQFGNRFSKNIENRFPDCNWAVCGTENPAMPDADLSGYDSDLPPQVSARHLRALQGKPLSRRREEEDQNPSDLKKAPASPEIAGSATPEANPPHDGS